MGRKESNQTNKQYDVVRLVLILNNNVSVCVCFFVFRVYPSQFHCKQRINLMASVAFPLSSCHGLIFNV